MITTKFLSNIHKFKLVLIFILTSFIYCEIKPAMHQPIYFSENHKKSIANGGNSLNLKFNISNHGKVITLFRGYSFILEFPSSSALNDNINVDCDLKVGNTMIAGITQETDVDAGIVKCICSEDIALDGVRLDGEVILTIKNISLKSNLYDLIKISLYTSKSNGTLIVQNPAFDRIGIYNDYASIANNDIYVQLTDFSVLNLTSSLDCEAPCTTLYPWSDYSIKFVVDVQRYIMTEESLIVFQINGDLPTSTPTIKSEAVPSEGDTVNSLYAKLVSNKVDGSLNLEYLGNGMYAIKDIAKYIDGTAEVKTFNLVPGRKFSITLTGFNTGSRVSVSTFSNVDVFVKWKNAPSYLSYFSKDISDLTQINKLTFKRAHDTDTDVTNSVENHDDKREIYENGSWQLKFEIRIPRAEAGVLTVETIPNTNVIFSFYASTCDFSADGVADDNIFGTRKVCFPTYNNYGTKIYRTVDEISGNNKSSFSMNIDKISGTNKDLIFSIWGYANKCSDASYDNESKIVIKDSIFKNNEQTFNIQFNYKYEIDGKVFIEKNFISNVICNKNLREESDGFKQYNMGYEANQILDSTKPYENIVLDYSEEGNTDTAYKRDYLLYQEFYDWNLFLTTTDSTSKLVTSNGLSGTSLSSFSGITELNTNIGIMTNENNPNSLGPVNIPMPYTQKFHKETNNFYTRTSVLLTGKLEFDVPSYATLRSDQENCHLTWFSENVNVQGAFSKSFSNSYEKLAVYDTTFKIITEDGNDSNNVNAPGILNYRKTSQPNNFYTGDTVANKLGFTSDCFVFKTYQNLEVKNIFSSLSFTYKFHRLIEGDTPVYKVNRVGRFFKFFNSQMGFSSTNITGDAALVDPLKSYIVTGSGLSADNQLCIISLNINIFNQLNEENNTLLISFLNTRLPKIGDYNQTDNYPTSKANTNIKVYPLYSESGNDLGFQLATDVVASDSSATLSQKNIYLNNGELFDYNNTKGASIYFGSGLVISGINAKSVTDQDLFSGSLYVAIYCPYYPNSSPIRDNVYITAQSFSIGSQGNINKSQNKLIKLSDNYYLRMENNLVANSERSAISNFSLLFNNYRSTITEGLNNLNLANSQGVTSYYNILLLTNDIVINSDRYDGTEAQLFGSSFTEGHIQSVKINDIQYNHTYFSGITVNGSQTLSNVNVPFFDRPTINTAYSDRRVKIHGVGLYPHSDSVDCGGSSTNCNAYFTNSPEQNNSFIELNGGNSEPTVTGGELGISATITIVGTPYKNDSGANFTLTVRVYSNLNLTGTLTIGSNNILQANSLCVEASDPNKKCTTGTDKINCPNIEVSEESYSTIVLSCYNFLIPENSKVTILADSTRFTADQADLLTAVLQADLTQNFSAEVDISNVISIQPLVKKVEFVQARQEGGLGVAFILLDLGRSYRIGQTLMLKGNLNSIYINNKRPNCNYALTDSFVNLENFNFFDHISKGGNFVNTCEFNESNGVNHIITIKTRHYIPKTNYEFSQNILLILSPIHASNINTIKYGIQTYLGESENTKIAAEEKVVSEQFTYPPLSPSLSTDLYKVTPSNQAGLCNLESVFPRIPGGMGEYVFNINIEGSTDHLDKINSEGGTRRVLNEISIYFDPSIYQKNEYFWCYSLNAQNNNIRNKIACEWTIFGFVNIRFENELSDRNDHKILIKGVKVPYSTDSGKEFYCSVNYFNRDERENIYVGKGTNNNLATYTPIKKGNILFFKHPDGNISNTIPRERSNFNFRFIVDYTMNLSTISQTLTASGSNRAQFIIEYPMQYDFNFLDTQIKATLTYTTFNVETNTYSTPSEPISLNPVRIFNYIKLELDGNPFEILPETAYYDLVLENVPTPWMSIHTSQINIALINDENSPSDMIRSYTNLNKYIGESKDENTFDSYYHGPSFAFKDEGKALIEPEATIISMKPGRYQKINFTLTGENANASTNITLEQNEHFRTMEESVIINTGRKKTSVLNLGSPCNTLYGSYWALFSSSNTENFYNLVPLRIIVTQVKGNVEKINFNTVPNTLIDQTVFPLAPGGKTTIYVSIAYMAFEDINLSFSSPQDHTNNTSFRQSPNSNPNIKSQTSSSRFSYEIMNQTEQEQKVIIKSGNRCFGFGPNGDDSRTISFTVDQALADLNEVNLAENFSYVLLSSDDDINQLKIKFTPILNTIASFILTCSDATFPSQSNVQSDEGMNVNTPLTQIQHHVFMKTDDQILIFKNLQRGSSYKLKAWVSNFGINPETRDVEFSSVKESTNVTNIIDLNIPDIQTRRYVEIKFINAQSKALLDRVLWLTQEWVNKNDDGSIITVSNSDGNTNSGYSIIQKIDCTNTTALNYFSNIELPDDNADNSTVINTDTTNDAQTNSSLRYLQDENSNTTNSTDTTETPSNSTANSNTTDTTEPIVTYNYTEYMVFNQDPTDPKSINIKTLVDNYVESINSNTKFNNLFSTDIIQLNGDFIVNEAEDSPLNPQNFVLQSFNYNNENGYVQFIPITLQKNDIKCDWKLRTVDPNSAQIALSRVDQLEITNCNQSASGISEKICGEVIFKYENTKVETLLVGLLNPGDYLVDFYCYSPLPNSNNNAVFSNSELINVKPIDTTPVDNNNDNTITDECDPLEEDCYSKRFNEFIMILFTIICLFYIDI